MRADPVRACQICGGPIDITNTIGICSRKPGCRTVASAVHKMNAARRRRRPHTGNWRARARGAKADHVPDTSRVPGDGDIDDVAVEAAVSGARKVRLTDAERREAARQLIRKGEGIVSLARHLDMPISRALILIDHMGYEVRSDRFTPGPENANQRLIKRKRP